MKKKQTSTANVPRPPVIVVMGHIDHGKSTLLDSIRKTNIVETEAGGITQHLSAYEVSHKGDAGVERRITFLDTPGHEAFQKMRLRGAEVADIAVLVVSAEEGVKPQTIEAYDSIKKAGLSFIVAINKIDKPAANIERTKQSLAENNIYLEGMGGDIPWVAISAKQGTSISELLDLMLLVADLKELTGNPEMTAEGIIIEAHLDPRKGISATLIIKNGTLKSGMCIVSGDSLSPVRIFEDFTGKPIKEASFSSPVRVVGWNKLPKIGNSFSSFDSKKDAEHVLVDEEKQGEPSKDTAENEDKRLIIPIILKADVSGALDAVEHEIEKLKSDLVHIKIIQKGVGAVSENDVKVAIGAEGTSIISFNTDMDRSARDLADRSGVDIQTFDIIYKLSEWLSEVLEKRTPKVKTEEATGRAKILKNFSRIKNKQIVGGKVLSGVLKIKGDFRIVRKDVEIGRGTIANLQQQKVDAKDVSEGNEFGAQFNSPIEIIPGDIVESYITKVT